MGVLTEVSSTCLFEGDDLGFFLFTVIHSPSSPFVAPTALLLFDEVDAVDLEVETFFEADAVAATVGFVWALFFSDFLSDDLMVEGFTVVLTEDLVLLAGLACFLWLLIFLGVLFFAEPEDLS